MASEKSKELASIRSSKVWFIFETRDKYNREARRASRPREWKTARKLGKPNHTPPGSNQPYVKGSK